MADSGGPDRLSRQAPGPTSRAKRALAPDLARGFMLLFIALVNAQFFLASPEIVTSAADQAVAVAQSTLVNGRAIPLFSLLFGYGMVQLLRRLGESGEGWIRTRGLLRRRGMWMLAIGFAHGALLLPVDIIGAYGLAVLVFVGLLRARDATLLWASGAIVAASIALTTVGMLLIPPDEGASVAPPSLTQRSFLLATADRVQEWALYTPITVLTVVLPPLLWGIWAARRRILEDPARHRALLVGTAVVGLGMAVAGGLPDALVFARLWTDLPVPASNMLAVLHDATGWAGGLGWAAVIGLVALKVERRRGPVTRAVEAVGQRSMTCYLAQSVVFVPIFAPYGAGLGASLGVTGAAVIGTATWGSTVLLAEGMRRWNHRGPAELLVRVGDRSSPRS